MGHKKRKVVMSKQKTYYKVWAKHEFRVCYLVPDSLLTLDDNDDEESEEGKLLDLLCNKNIVYVDPSSQSIEFDRSYMDSKGIRVILEDVDGDPSPTLSPRMTADWDITIEDEESESESESESEFKVPVDNNGVDL